MAPTTGDRTFVDTNVLIDATDSRRLRHSGATDLLETHDDLAMSAQIAREYLVVVTRPKEVNGLGMALKEALSNLTEFRRAVRMLPEEKPLLPRLLELLRKVPCRGARIHDALVVVAMQAHGVSRLVTSNGDDFARFEGLIEVTSLEGALGSDLA